MKKIITLITFFIITGCSVKNEDKHNGKYVVYLGNALYSEGHVTNEYTVENGFILFYKTSGNKMIIPINNVFYIYEQ